MGCLLFKESKLNFLENLKTEEYINSRRELTFEKDVHKYLNDLVNRLNLNYDLNLKALATIEEVKIKTGKDFSRDSEKFILTPIEESFEQIDNRRKELGIYEDRISIGEYNKTQGEKISNQEERENLVTDSKQAVNQVVKPGVSELFESNPELANQVYEALGFKEIIKTLTELKPLTKELLDFYKINPNLEIDNVKNVNNILKSISENSPWKHFRNLASIYLNYTKEIPYRIEFKNLAKGNGVYLKQFRLLEIENKLLDINNDLDRFNYEMVILHEMTHGLTLYGYNTNKEFKSKVDKLFEFAKLNSKNKNAYGLTSAEEFLAEILVNPDFQKEMNNISYSRDTTVLTFFNSLIKELLNSMGIKFNKNSVLSEAVDLSLSIIPLSKEDLKSYKDVDLFSNQITPQQKQQAQQLYSQYLDSLNKPNTNPILQGNQTNIEEIITQLEKDGLLEIDCKGKLKAEKGLQTNFTKGGKWKLVKDLKGYPTHKEGGVDLTIGKDGVSIKNGNTEFTAKHGLVIPKN